LFGGGGNNGGVIPAILIKSNSAVKLIIELLSLNRPEADKGLSNNSPLILSLLIKGGSVFWGISRGMLLINGLLLYV